jgi:hypothetical protein
MQNEDMVGRKYNKRKVCHKGFFQPLLFMAVPQ